jgi:hypothetical protein
VSKGQLPPQPVRTNVYVDGFNLYFGCIKGTPYKWLNLAELCRLSLPGHFQINRIRYFTAVVKPRSSDLDKPERQKAFLRALQTIPNLTIHLGQFRERCHALSADRSATSCSEPVPADAHRRGWNDYQTFDLVGRQPDMLWLSHGWMSHCDRRGQHNTEQAARCLGYSAASRSSAST